jgi:GNAT superfamily N-acetyltransferase
MDGAMTSVEGLRIRPLAEPDVELLFGLILELAAYEKLSDEVAGDAEVLRRTLFEQRAAEALLLELDGEAIGYAIFFTTFSSFECRSGIWLEDVYVRPEHRRGGIGRAVMEHLAALALERGHVRLEWCALDWNEPALRFYEKLGARPLGDWITHRLDRDGIRRLASAADPAPGS